jgi:regulator of protease activity HflC (stomatin/prohibitin superfamily)
MEIVVIAIAIMVIVFVYKGIIVIRNSERMVIERLGNYSRTLMPGINFIVPFLDKPRDFIWCQQRMKTEPRHQLKSEPLGLFNLAN